MIPLRYNFLLMLILIPWSLMAQQEQEQEQEQFKINHHHHPHHYDRRHHRRRLSGSTYLQFTVDSFLNAVELQQDVLLHISASPIELSAQDLTEIEIEFQNAYNRQQIVSCGGTDFYFHPVFVTSVEILVNAIDGFGNEPRTISEIIDFSYLMAVNYTCYGCATSSSNQDEYMNLTLFNDDIGNSYYYDPRTSYQVPFPSSSSSLSVPCVPNQANVLNDLQTSGFISTINGLENIYSADPIPTNRCDDDSDFTPFSSYFTIAVNGDYDIADLEIQLEQVEQAIVEAYNELNILNPNTCDVNSRIAVNANVTVEDPKTQGTRRRLNEDRFAYSWFFLYAEIDGACNGCPSNSCLTNDVSGYETCSAIRRRRHRQLQASSNNYTSDNDLSCFCVQDNVDATLPTNEELLEALEEQFEILRNESSFSLVTDIVYLIEVDVPDSCCGWPANGNIPVPPDVSAGALESAISSYIMDPMSSAYGYPINCWDTSAVTDMTSAFENQIDFNEPLSCWDTSNVVTFQAMFLDAQSFNQDLSTWDTAKVTNTSRMFAEADSFNGMLTNWDTSSLTTMNTMFRAAVSFNQPLSHFDTSKVTEMNAVFRQASLFNQDISNWNTTSVTSIANMFHGASNFDQDISGWFSPPSSLVDMDQAFTRCRLNQDLSNWDISSVTSLNRLFLGADGFNFDISGWDTSKVSDFRSTFENAPSFNVDISMWDTSSAVTMLAMFKDATSFNQNLNNWNTEKVFDMFEMFSGASLFNSPLDNWNVSSVTDMGSMFFNALEFDQDLNTWDVSQVTSMGSMFARAEKFNQDLSNWVLSSLQEADLMFFKATAFNGDVSMWDVSQVTTMQSMFLNAEAFNIDISSWDISKVESVLNMFAGALQFQQDLCPWRLLDDNLVNASNVFSGTNCINMGDPVADVGPWCFAC